MLAVDNVKLEVVPEPSTVILLAIGNERNVARCSSNKTSTGNELGSGVSHNSHCRDTARSILINARGVDLKNTGCPHSSTNAHCNHAVAATTTTQLMKELRRQLGPGSHPVDDQVQ